MITVEEVSPHPPFDDSRSHCSKCEIYDHYQVSKVSGVSVPDIQKKIAAFFKDVEPSFQRFGPTWTQYLFGNLTSLIRILAYLLYLCLSCKVILVLLHRSSFSSLKFRKNKFPSGDLSNEFYFDASSYATYRVSKPPPFSLPVWSHFQVSNISSSHIGSH